MSGQDVVTKPGRPRSRPMEPKDTLIDGRYRLGDCVGVGGMGRVYEAYDLRLRARRAIKFLDLPQDPVLSERFRKRLLREAQAAQTLGARTHHVVRVFDIGFTEAEDPFLVMEFVEGQTLGERLRLVGALPPAEAVEVMATVAETIGIGHELGTLHRDIKPGNIMLADGDVVKLIDFGLAKQPNASTLTGERSSLGTLQYMAPEQLKGRPEPRSDVFAIAATLFEALSATRAVQAATQVEAYAILLETGIRSLAVECPHLPVPLISLVDRALSLDADQRPENGRAFGEELRALLPHVNAVLTNLPTWSRILEIPRELLSEEAHSQADTSMFSLSEVGTIPPDWSEALTRTPSQVAALADTGAG